VAGQGQPKHLNIQPHGQYHALKTQRIGSEKTYVGSVYRMRSLAVSGFLFKRTADLAARLHTSFAHDLSQGGGTAPFSQEIHKLSTETL